MKFFDPHPEYVAVKAEVDRSLQAVIDRCAFIMGEEVGLFEQEVAAYMALPGQPLCGSLGVSSGTDALLLALLAAGVGPGDEVVTTPFTFIATAEAIVQAGAKPVFADIDLKTFNIDPQSMAAVVTPKTKALLPVHLFGLAADMTAVMELAQRRHCQVVEDVAQSMGALWKGQRLGTLGDYGCFSFFPSKTLGGFGDSGLVLCRDKAKLPLLQALRVHGSLVRYEHEMVGYNARMDTLQAAVLRAKLKHLDAWIAQRRAVAARYLQQLQGVGDLLLPGDSAASPHTYNQFSLRTGHRNALVNHLHKKGVPTAVYYPKPLHVQKAFASLGYRFGDFPHSEAVAQSIVSLPVYPFFPEESQNKVIEAIRDFFQNLRKTGA